MKHYKRFYLPIFFQVPSKEAHFLLVNLGLYQVVHFKLSFVSIQVEAQITANFVEQWT